MHIFERALTRLAHNPEPFESGVSAEKMAEIAIARAKNRTEELVARIERITSIHGNYEIANPHRTHAIERALMLEERISALVARVQAAHEQLVTSVVGSQRELSRSEFSRKMDEFAHTIEDAIALIEEYAPGEVYRTLVGHHLSKHQVVEAFRAIEEGSEHALHLPDSILARTAERLLSLRMA